MVMGHVVPMDRVFVKQSGLMMERISVPNVLKIIMVMIVADIAHVKIQMLRIRGNVVVMESVIQMDKVVLAIQTMQGCIVNTVEVLGVMVMDLLMMMDRVIVRMVIMGTNAMFIVKLMSPVMVMGRVIPMERVIVK